MNDNNCVMGLMGKLIVLCEESGMDVPRQIAALNAARVALEAMELDNDISESDLESEVLRSVFRDLMKAGVLRGVN
jgi:hypothetical protein